MRTTISTLLKENIYDAFLRMRKKNTQILYTSKEYKSTIERLRLLYILSLSVIRVKKKRNKKNRFTRYLCKYIARIQLFLHKKK